ncbi:Outer membrane protein assembly factor BamB, contains PQQ-like beta-propeller repeat [Rathayibacter oskolensis]|uniref:Outer membrane protein assembly factor BamB, contains PQQ-like beta-propeller repeat n=1 Tax=Rathayibacter oskolensis TaxID=1891671 RepID=A0A1X7MTX3_9MICO|nr:PQQ-binding-like beta-propeller repeat protein [Rathayibacter oskolensis]SMH28196.1 Outer membrane protein assembly factor BamB, contains PQQ-like beta-propeller repeat [Rathayibacter oskolensis]
MHGHITDGDTGAPRSGVVVTNGVDVTATDADGRYDLPDRGDFVVITRPSGTTAATWWRRRAELDGTGRADFALTAVDQPLPYRFVHLTDTHMTVPEGVDPDADAHRDNFLLYREGSLPAQIDEFLAELDRHAPDVQSIMITGDLVDHGLPAQYRAYLEVMATSPVPVHLIPGNHDHMNGGHDTVVSRNNYLTNAGTVENYERFVGPRWYSFDVAGLHVVAMDWHSHELGLDHEQQNAWVANDLAALTPGAPWILLFHDQPGSSLVDHLPWQPIASFSGHWHTSRVVDVEGTMHVNSPTTFFASLDYSPPAYRIVTWDGTGIALETRTLTAESEPSVRTATFAASRAEPASGEVLWRSQLTGAAHRQSASIDGTLVLAGSQIEDRAAGTVEAFDLASGERVWSAATSSAVKTTPLAAGDLVIAAEVSGDVTAHHRETGDLVWRTPSSDPLRRFAWGGLALADGRVFVGDQADLRCLDAATGAVIWRRTDLSPHHNLVNHAAPLIVGDLLVMGFWPTPQHPVGLDARTGESVWATEEPDTAQAFKTFKRLLIMGTAAFDPATDAAYLPAFGGTTRVDGATGAVRWIAEHPGGFSPSTPLVTERGIVATAAGQGIRMLDSETGATIWDLDIAGDAPFPMASYTKIPHPVLAAPTLVDGELLLPGLDGVIRRVDFDGRQIGESALGVPLASSLTDAGGALVAVGVDGGVLALERTVAGARVLAQESVS